MPTPEEIQEALEKYNAAIAEEMKNPTGLQKRVLEEKARYEAGPPQVYLTETELIQEWEYKFNRVEELERELKQTRADIRALAAECVAFGIPISVLAEVVGITRQRVSQLSQLK